MPWAFPDPADWPAPDVTPWEAVGDVSLNMPSRTQRDGSLFHHCPSTLLTMRHEALPCSD